MLASGGLLVLLVVVYLLLWEPPAVGIRKLSDDLPRLRAENASMLAMAGEAARLRGAAGNATPIAPTDRVAAVRRSLERAGLWSAVAAATPLAGSPAPPQTVRTLSVRGAVTTVAAAPQARIAPPEIAADGERVRVRFDDIDYGLWVAWLASAEGELSARAARVAISSTAPKGAVGHVKTEAWLDWTPSSAPARS
jgi:type II secretory pathway component PulM